jgi:hypothetical protein
MSDSLRDRIAAVLNSFPADMRPVAVVNLEKADAVIRELSAFHREVSEDDFLDALLGEDDETD